MWFGCIVDGHLHDANLEFGLDADVQFRLNEPIDGKLDANRYSFEPSAGGPDRTCVLDFGGTNERR